ncbi:hypothetical protein [Ornithinibacillus scapharcae]|uniref:hypothetical protein n=1 Tax=Ornithinibacillus scapharcae TaxID=1147159 RepID=UPI000225BD43|nr:hypothetical protein [Ornithinibacillus scapharcae]
MSGNKSFFTLIHDSLMPGNIYVLFLRNGKNIILRINKVNSLSGSIQGYDHRGRLTALNIKSISGFGELSSFPNVVSSKYQTRNKQHEYASGEEKNSFAKKVLAREGNIEPRTNSNYQGKGNSWEVETQQQEKAQTYSQTNDITVNVDPKETLENPLANVGESNEESVNYREYKAITQINSKRLVSLSALSINGNSVIEESGRAIVGNIISN